jgi:prepilin-type N-terminal cleavage/methylation domain-containing protein
VNARAFTLPELLLVVLITALVSAMGSPLFSRSHELREVRRAADETVYLLRYARVRAMTEQTLYKVDFSDREFVLLRAVDFSESPERTLFSNLEGSSGRVRVLPAKASFYGQPQEVFCYPDGRIDRVRFFVRSADAGFVISTQEYIGHVTIREEDNGK